ncbi:Dual specificity phosphatase, catalytic domain [Seminavis robusta]|uniref:Dual specificity phosphatase, catalytic domain n=1 Tax=Seminavis robusta TaxID=568900 RepID=A0A9N8H057_9STRA|nr:Dual specificity phosphatase, catalytic domain [Seminavis robusta]|eukprot:Sro15_g010920.1 Dual specificity phosphatase, catalytic domain (182) ;mRNA; r:26113-26658
MSENEDVVVTPRNPETLHNFGPASARDSILYTSERPGGDPEGGAKIPKSKVLEWIEFMKTENVKHVMLLLDDNELETYEEPGLLALYKEHGLSIHRNPMGPLGSSSSAEKTIKEVETANEKVVAHCTHGMGRSGRVAAGWLVMRYGLTPQEATDEVVDMARKNGQERMGNVKALEKWLSNK